MGSNTDGCNGSDRPMPLPGGVWMYFSVMGAYHPDGTQTQRTGIAPDIRVEPTIQGIAEGRDEVLEAFFRENAHAKHATDDVLFARMISVLVCQELLNRLPVDAQENIAAL